MSVGGRTEGTVTQIEWKCKRTDWLHPEPTGLNPKYVRSILKCVLCFSMTHSATLHAAWPVSCFFFVVPITTNTVFLKSLEMCGKQFCGNLSPPTISRTHHHHLNQCLGPRDRPFFVPEPQLTHESSMQNV